MELRGGGEVSLLEPFSLDSSSVVAMVFILNSCSKGSWTSGELRIEETFKRAELETTDY